ncbi:hypothetical protein EVAR_62376_1 [Eumeta japonica]|uniref:Uncharacterized protein n=1 Tax=Eumeta variegata TaxID=151549 RepID=A0A4C1YX54_EUMVA|nr:hypothetical protein EVAR_62376_1 [Eumeta japonica]
MTHIPSWLSSLPITFPYCASLPSHLLVPIRPQIATDYLNSTPTPLHTIKRVTETSGGHSNEIEILQTLLYSAACSYVQFYPSERSPALCSGNTPNYLT